MKNAPTLTALSGGLSEHVGPDSDGSLGHGLYQMNSAEPPLQLMRACLTLCQMN